MNDKKIRFYIRVQHSVLIELKQRAKLQGVPVQDLARLCLERSLAIQSMDEARKELILAAQNVIARSAKPFVTNQDSQESIRAGLKSIFFIEQYLRSLALKEPDPIGSAERITNKKIKEFGL